MSDTRRIERIAIGELVDWVLQQGVYGTHFEPLLVEMCERLVAAGVPLARVNFSMRTLHPEIGAFAYRWKRVSGIEREDYERRLAEEPSSEWSLSPLKALMESESYELRHKLTDEGRPFPFPMFEDLKAQGATDYFATQVVFDPSITALPPGEFPSGGMMISWTADGPDGFSDTDLQAIRRLLPAIALALKSNGMEQMADDLLAAYLGKDAAQRVKSGSIIRGSVDAIEAVIVYFDLSGFTKLSEELPGPDIIDLLNAYFGAVVPEIENRGGNVLKFMGDGMLAIFARDTVPNTENIAVDAICAIRDTVDAVSKERAADGLAQAGCTMSAHAGEVLYGNIGAASRLDFTVIGPAVNTAARINAMSAHVDQPIVLSANVARPLLDTRSDLVSLGQYRLRGVRNRQELFTLD